MNYYTIINTGDTAFPYSIISGETTISNHASLNEAKAVKAQYYAGDRGTKS